MISINISVFYNDIVDLNNSLFIFSTDSEFCDHFGFQPNDSQLMKLDKLFGPDTSHESVSLIKSAVRQGSYFLNIFKLKINCIFFWKGLPDKTLVVLYDSVGMGRMYHLNILIADIKPNLKINDGTFNCSVDYHLSDQRTFGGKWAVLRIHQAILPTISVPSFVEYISEPSNKTIQCTTPTLNQLESYLVCLRTGYTSGVSSHNFSVKFNENSKMSTLASSGVDEIIYDKRYGGREYEFPAAEKKSQGRPRNYMTKRLRRQTELMQRQNHSQLQIDCCTNPKTRGSSSIFFSNQNFI